MLSSLPSIIPSTNCCFIIWEQSEWERFFSPRDGGLVRECPLSEGGAAADPAWRWLHLAPISLTAQLLLGGCAPASVRELERDLRALHLHKRHKRRKGLQCRIKKRVVAGLGILDPDFAHSVGQHLPSRVSSRVQWMVLPIPVVNHGGRLGGNSTPDCTGVETVHMAFWSSLEAFVGNMATLRLES